MKKFATLLALGLVAATLVRGAALFSAEAKGFRGHSHGQGQQFGGHRLGGHTQHFGHRFSHGFNYCWKFGRWVCGSRSY